MNVQVTSSVSLLRGAIEEILETGEIIVSVADPPARILCDFLQTSHAPPPPLARGDLVLVCPPPGPQDKGVVMGRVGPYQAPDLDHVTIEAGMTLTLKCGAASLLLRNDGKMLSRAQDIAAIANRTHRIKGGSVEIN